MIQSAFSGSRFEALGRFPRGGSFPEIHQAHLPAYFFNAMFSSLKVYYCFPLKLALTAVPLFLVVTVFDAGLNVQPALDGVTMIFVFIGKPPWK